VINPVLSWSAWLRGALAEHSQPTEGASCARRG